LLGIIIDARGRPLRMDDDPNMRRLQIWDWLVAMGVEEGVSPYVDPSINSLADLDLANLEDETQRPSSPASLETPPEPGSIESDLASLRQTVAEPEKPDKKKKKKGGAARKKKR
jgi:hypothetical protein